MKNQLKRSYNSELRLKLAQERKSRILASAKHLFKEKGFQHVTITEIATMAQVSPPTIYALFQSKRGVLLSIMDTTLPSHEFEALVKKAKQEKSIKKRLMISAEISRKMYDAEKSFKDFFISAAILSPEFGEIENFREQRRYKRQLATVQAMIEENLLSSDLDLPTARDILWAFTGRDMYRLLVIERGWSSDKYEKWLSKTLLCSLTERI